MLHCKNMFACWLKPENIGEELHPSVNIAAFPAASLCPPGKLTMTGAEELEIEDNSVSAHEYLMPAI